MVLHAEPQHGADGRPDANSPLTDRGRRDASSLVGYFRDIRIAAIYSSPYRRAIETVGPLAASRSLPITENVDFREHALGPGPFRENDFELAVRATWNDCSYSHAGGESNGAAQLRAVTALDELLDRHHEDALVISTHATLLALILRNYDPAIGFEFWRKIAMPEVYRLARDERGITHIDRLAR